MLQAMEAVHKKVALCLPQQSAVQKAELKEQLTMLAQIAQIACLAHNSKQPAD